MTQAAPVTDQTIRERLVPFPKAHFLAASDLNPFVTPQLLDLGDAFVDFNRQSFLVFCCWRWVGMNIPVLSAGSP